MIDFTTDTERKRCKQIDKCRDLLEDVTDCLGFGIDTRKATNRLIKLRNYLNKELPDKKAKAALDALRKEREEMLDVIVRINNWCAQDLAECAPSGNYEKTLKGLCDICKPYAALASRLKKYGGTEECLT
jgi:phage terminase large subunit